MTVRWQKRMLPAWERFDAADMFLSGGKAITHRRHVHVYNNDGKLLGRIVLETMAPLDDWSPPRRVVKILKELEKEGRL